MQTIALVFLIILIICEAIADYFAGAFSEYQRVIFFVLASGFYLIGNISWLFALTKGVELGKGALIFSVSSAVFGILIGILVYGEHFSYAQAIGAILGIISLALIFY